MRTWLRTTRFILTAATLMMGATLGASTARAQGSEFFHQPALGINEVTVHGAYALGTVRLDQANATDADLNGARDLGGSYFYGYSDMWAFGADVAYTTLSSDPGRSSGIEPIKLFALGKKQFSVGSLQYGLRAQFAVDKSKLEGNDSNRTYGDALSGFAEGGFELAPYVGWSSGLGPGVWGAKVSYEVVNTSVKTDTDLGEQNFKGGAEGNAYLFYEYMLADMPLGIDFNYKWFTDLDIEGVVSDNARSLYGIDLYTRIGGTGWAFIPTLTWREKASSDYYDKLSDVRLNVAGRFEF